MGSARQAGCITVELLIAYFGTIAAVVVLIGWIAWTQPPMMTRDVWGEYCLQMVDHIVAEYWWRAAWESWDWHRRGCPPYGCV